MRREKYQKRWEFNKIGIKANKNSMILPLDSIIALPQAWHEHEKSRNQ